MIAKEFVLTLITQHNFCMFFSLEELIASNPLFPSQNARDISIVSKASILGGTSRHPAEIQQTMEKDSKAEARDTICPDAIIDEILKAGFFRHSKIAQ